MKHGPIGSANLVPSSNPVKISANMPEAIRLCPNRRVRDENYNMCCWASAAAVLAKYEGRNAAH